MISGGALCSFGPQLVVDASKVFDETPILAFSFHFVRISKQGRWMNGHPNYGGKRSTPRPSSNVLEPNRFAEDGLSGRDAEADDHPRFYDLESPAMDGRRQFRLPTASCACDACLEVPT